MAAPRSSEDARTMPPIVAPTAHPAASLWSDPIDASTNRSGVASSDDEGDPEAAVVFHHSDGWGVAFLVVDDGQPVFKHEAPRVVVSVYAFETYEHNPSAAYLRAYGPHDLEGDG